MNEEFINSQQTILNEDKNFVNWHKGRKRYVIWGLEIDDKDWSENLKLARELLGPYLLQGVNRRSHITLFACGFVEDEACSEMINTQICSLKQSDFKPFSLQLNKMDSFLSAPYFSIKDLTGSIESVRLALSGCATEDRQNVYQAHLTIGLYADAYPTEELAIKIRQFNEAFQNMPLSQLMVNKISLMSYATDSVFSKLETEFQLHL